MNDLFSERIIRNFRNPIRFVENVRLTGKILFLTHPEPLYVVAHEKIAQSDDTRW